MTVDVEVGGRVRRVDIRREGERWAVVLDGRELSADLVALGGRWSLVLSEAGRQASHEIAIEERGPGERIVHVDGQPIPAVLPDSRRLFGRRAHESAVPDGPARIAAPMPGRVVKILARPGDTAAAGQPLVIVEAMKMENELRAPRSGTITEIRVAEGASIEANTVLMVLE